MTIPIIMLNWNGIEDTLEAVGDLMEQSYQDFKLYLVDNGSAVDNVEILKREFSAEPRIELILNTENLGFTEGNNVVMAQLLKADYKYLVLLNNDVGLEKDWLEELVASAERSGAGMVGSNMINYFERTKMDNAGHRMLNTAEVIPYAHSEPVENFQTEFENFGPCAGAALYSCDMLRTIGIFDDFFATGYEDAELGVRACILGYKSIFEPKAVVYHKTSQSINKIINFEYKLKIQHNIFYTYFKLMPWPVILINIPSMIFKYGAVVVIDVVFSRNAFFKVMKEAWRKTLFTEKHIIKKKRQDFYKKHQPISSWRILRKQEFFLWFDIKRFYKHIILKEDTFLEREREEG